MSNIPRARMILAAQYDSIKLNALATAVLIGKYDNKPEMKAVLAALDKSPATPTFVTDSNPTWRNGTKSYTVTVEGASMKIMVMDGAHVEFIGEASTPAAPGIDLEQFREVVEYRYSAELAAFERGCRSEGHLEREKSERSRLLALIDASPTIGKRPKALQ